MSAGTDTTKHQHQLVDVEKKDSYGKTWSSGHGLNARGWLMKRVIVCQRPLPHFDVFSIVILVYFQFWEGMGYGILKSKLAKMLLFSAL